MFKDVKQHDFLEMQSADVSLLFLPTDNALCLFQSRFKKMCQEIRQNQSATQTVSESLLFNIEVSPTSKWFVPKSCISLLGATFIKVALVLFKTTCSQTTFYSMRSSETNLFLIQEW